MLSPGVPRCAASENQLDGVPKHQQVFNVLIPVRAMICPSLLSRINGRTAFTILIAEKKFVSK
jgi:hypothetical protein